MAFPISPANNQIALVNGIEYYYNTTKGAWYRYGDATANVITSNTFQVLSSLVFLDTTSQNTAFTGTAIDLTARVIANAAFIAANAATATDTTQNNSITAAFNTANASFTVANNAVTSANGTIIWNTANAAFLAANSAAGDGLAFAIALG